MLSMLSKFLDIEVYYWTSGQARRGFPRWTSFFPRLRHEVADIRSRIALMVVYRVVTGPESMVTYYEQAYRVPKRRIVTAYNDVDLKVFKPLVGARKEGLREELGLDPAATYVLFVGRVSNYKGGDLLLPLAESLREEAALVEILVIGQIHLPSITSDLLGHSRLRYLGAMSNRDALRYYQASDLFVLPSRSEGFPRVVLEAMACGLPLAAFDVGGVRDIVGPRQGALVFPSDDLLSLAQGVKELIHSPALREAVSLENLKSVQRFSTERVANHFLQAVVSR